MGSNERDVSLICIIVLLSVASGVQAEGALGVKRQVVLP